MHGDDRARALVPFECGKRREMPPREADGMPARSAVTWRDNAGAGVERIGDAANRRRRHPRHVGERDDPASRVGRRVHAGRETSAHAFVGAGRFDDAQSRVAQRIRKHDVAAATPTKVPAGICSAPWGSGASSLSPPKRLPRPAASRMPAMRVTRIVRVRKRVATASAQP